ncbi:MAG: L-threonylcarbamoyladenylate synthase [Bacteroidales bacterium]|nr:L-threonylcarbamoyladenylate synthase [Bacteroidales bacterium]
MENFTVIIQEKIGYFCVFYKEKMVREDDIIKAASYIREGKLVAFPTETVYGLGANALDPLAVAKIFELKRRPSFDPLIVHIADIRDISTLVATNDNRIYQLAEKFWPGPLTLVLPKKSTVPDIVTAGLPNVGIRMPNHPIALSLIKQAQRPIAAPSANKFGKVSPTTAQHVQKHLPGVDFILDGGKTQVGIESTIIKLNEKGFDILRNGVITKEDIEKIIPYAPEDKDKNAVLASGMMHSHYSPDKPIYILNDNLKVDREKAGLLSFTGQDIYGYKKVIYVSKNTDMREYAANLFEAIHQLEDSDVDYIVAEPVPEEGIGMAIMDRLKKASYRYQKR